ncbi:PEP-CTERM sorting domain-containing protein [Sphingomonas piscis]|uniref:PEP-CTERM sorting domain-containing protein n=1 Tax=Sphingomonas piscis TaxID=2714943 RepID=A0A6G7YQW7_9SPHN|nr:FxDxF family PEP-CTERM protein [Sphingomonas piscis]QIK79131.1 PEP-CTERM sorting domain-containing protein [Sphingomonas piscis]
MAALIGVAAMAGASPASAVVLKTELNQVALDTANASNFGAIFSNQPAFNLAFGFTLGTDMDAISSITTTLNTSNDVDFSSVLLDGYAFTQTGFDGSGAEVWELLMPVSLSAGLHNIFVNGTTGPSRNGSFGGNLELSAPAVPEPATWAMMLVGFGAIGASVRRSRRTMRHVLQAA